MSTYFFYRILHIFPNCATCNATSHENTKPIIYIKVNKVRQKQTRTIVGRVDGELDDGVTDVCLRFSGGKSLFGWARERDVQERGYTGWRQERIPTTGHSRRRWRHAIL